MFVAMQRERGAMFNSISGSDADRVPAYGFGGWYVAASLHEGKRVFGVCAESKDATLCFLPDGSGQVATLGIKIGAGNPAGWLAPTVKVHFRNDANWPGTDDDSCLPALATPVGDAEDQVVLLLEDLRALKLHEGLPKGRMRISLLADLRRGSNRGDRYVFVDMDGFGAAWQAMLARRHAAYTILTQE